MKFTKGHIINTIRFTITQGTRLCIVYCLGVGISIVSRYFLIQGDQDHPGVHDPHTYSIWCPLTQETRIYMYLVYGWGSQPFSIFLIIFCFRGIRTTNVPIDVPPTYQLMCHHARNKNIHCLGNRIPIVFRDIWSFPIPGGRMTSGAIYYFPQLACNVNV